MKVTQKDEVDIVEEYEKHLVPMAVLAKRYGMTRQGIWKVLKRWGVDTEKKRIEVSCTACGRATLRPKCQIRAHRHLFCSLECYYAYVEAKQPEGRSKARRHGQRIARAKVSEVFDLQPGHIVHHVDRNQWNNNLDNLMVFANQGDHIRYHRWGKDGAGVHPLWEGSKT